MAFSDEEIERYARHLVLREIGGPGQQRLKAAGVLVVGVGGVGGPAAMYLAAAGVGRIGLLDFDAVSLSNLQRQVLFATQDVGRPKVEVAAERLDLLNPHVLLEPLQFRLDEENAAELVRGYDLVIDGSDSFETRLTVNRACVAEGRTLISAAVGRWRSMVGVFRGRPCYACLVPAPPPDAETCAAVGVVGALTGLAGSAAALAAIKLLTDAGETDVGTLTATDTLSGDVRRSRVSPDPECPVCRRG